MYVINVPSLRLCRARVQRFGVNHLVERSEGIMQHGLHLVVNSSRSLVIHQFELIVHLYSDIFAVFDDVLHFLLGLLDARYTFPMIFLHNLVL